MGHNRRKSLMSSGALQGIGCASPTIHHHRAWNLPEVPGRTKACSRHLPASARTSLRLPGAAEAQRSGAPFNGATDCSCKEPYMDNGMRTMQQAPEVGNVWGLKPVKKRVAPANHTRLTARVL